MYKSEAETPNNFCPSRFSRVCSDFAFLQNTNLYSASRFTVQICVTDEKSRHVFCTDLRFGGKENVNTLEKI